MSGQLELQKAHGEFRQWIRRLRGNGARNAPLYAVDPVSREPITVQPAEAIECFLKHHPEWTQYSEHLCQLEVDPFSLVKELWEKACV